METIHVVLDTELLAAASRTARRRKQNRSALIRDALRDHLAKLEIREREERDRRGYEKFPAGGADGAEWESEAAWPE